ncbi:V-type proton ATPase 16 kDa proteolipid subunit-like [Vombatus ursinus]|uniref:V-type proton ATPase 16 kDa proteolipid subunit-like n=1 Tax=Vombatus ursinus TaxID=29139 RepID=UPI000FFD8EC6|nr:V-type proton ATPase 16 kDa proteolipid subunit-like [Vombatus ursinus]
MACCLCVVHTGLLNAAGSQPRAPASGPSGRSPSGLRPRADISARAEYASFLADVGAAAAMVFSALCAAYGKAKSGAGIAAMVAGRPRHIVKSIVAVVIPGIVAIDGQAVAVLLTHPHPVRTSLLLGAGLSVGLSGLAAGFAVGTVGGAGERGPAQQPRLFVGVTPVLVFAEVLGLYGLFVALIVCTK